VWLLIAGVIILSLITIIVQQRISRKKILEEMARAKKSEELKDIFLSNLSHSLRTPLNAIIGFSDLLLTTPQEEIKEEERNKLLEIVNSNGLQLLHLINELLSLSDIEGNNQLFNLQVTDIDAEMTSYAAETRMQMTDGVVLDVVEPVDGLRALTDKKLLRLVVMQLLENARQHTTRGSIILSYYAKEDGLYVEVKDTGSGLPEKLKENIFALLSDKNTYIQEDTPGLGLSICKAIVDKANGKIGFRDNDIDGQGSIFWFWLPVEIL
jgi:signal transduction histidine kinase